MAAKRFDDGKSPVVEGCFNYFPNALLAVGLVSKFGSDKYEVPLSEKNWLGLEQARIVNSEGRHLLKEAIEGPYDSESQLLHKAHKAWNALADLEKELMSGTTLANPELAGSHEEHLTKPPRQIVSDAFAPLSDSSRSLRETGHLAYAETLPPPADKGVGAAGIDTGETFQTRSGADL